jgi:4-hydroxy-3-methylbut-2-en-1-yl diphosphate reductase
VEGTAGRVTDRVHIISSEKEAWDCQVADERRVAFVTQTTLSVEDISGILDVLRERFPLIKGPSSSICFATQNRQNAVKKLAEQADLILVVGSKNSSNSNRLREVALRQGRACHLIDDREDLQTSWMEGVRVVGITAGASAPERLVEGVIEWMRERGTVSIRELAGTKEDIHFKATERNG